MMFVVRGFTPVAIMAAVALGVLASLVSGAFAAIVWISRGGGALAAFIFGSAAVPAALAACAAWSVCAVRSDRNNAAAAEAAGRPAPRDKPGRTRRPEVGELDEERALRLH